MFVAALPVLGQDGERSLIFGCGEEGEEGESCDMRKAMSMGDKSGHLPHLAAAPTPLQGAGGFSQLEVLPGGLSPSPLPSLSDLGQMYTEPAHAIPGALILLAERWGVWEEAFQLDGDGGGGR